MRWIGRRESDNIEDRRSDSQSNNGLGGGLGNYGLGNYGLGGSRTPLPISGKARLIIFAILIIIALANGVDPGTILQQGLGLSTSSDGASRNQLQGMYQNGAANDNRPPADAARHFVGVVLADTEDVWRAVFNARGKTYIMPKLVLFSGHTKSGCGFASAATGPFYCPTDEQIYIDLNFFIELQSDFGARGDFAQAYVIAHEVGHHVQQLLGTMERVDALRDRLPEKAANALQVKVELQADCYAGIWAKRTAQIHDSLEAGDIEEAMQAASAVGDDRLQKRGQGFVVPDSFTHGSAQQRSQWFHKGYENGTLESCDTFAVR